MYVPKKFYFVIIGHDDQLIYEFEFPVIDSNKTREKDDRPVKKFIVHSALDIVDERIKRSQQMYFKAINKCDEWWVSAFVTASTMRFIILHTVRADEQIKQFFHEMYEAYIKYSMNPFYELDTPIKSTDFEQKALYYGQKYLKIDSVLDV